jgi:hypothetical protein
MATGPEKDAGGLGHSLVSAFLEGKAKFLMLKLDYTPNLVME